MSIAFGPDGEEREVGIPADGVTLLGNLAVPADARGIVVFAHGSGSSRLSSRNRYVANVLRNSGLATLLFDLLTPEEEVRERYTAHLRFDIGLLARRLLDATDWVQQQPGLRDLPIGYFGASTGGGAALVAAAERPDGVRAVVSRGGRPDLAGKALARVKAPTLLIVGGEDPVVVGLNEDALRQLRAEASLEVVPGAGHLFEEPGALEAVAELATGWLVGHLARPVQERRLP